MTACASIFFGVLSRRSNEELALLPVSRGSALTLVANLNCIFRQSSPYAPVIDNELLCG